MAELLIKAIDAVHADSIKDARGCYKRGDVVVVQPDGFAGWGVRETLPPAQGGVFFIVKVPGVDPDLVRDKLEEMERSEFVLEGPGRGGVPTKRRTYGFDLSTLSAGTLQTIDQTGVLTLTIAAARSRFIHKVTRAQVF